MFTPVAMRTSWETVPMSRLPGLATIARVVRVSLAMEEPPAVPEARSGSPHGSATTDWLFQVRLSELRNWWLRFTSRMWLRLKTSPAQTVGEEMARRVRATWSRVSPLLPTVAAAMRKPAGGTLRRPASVSTVKAGMRTSPSGRVGRTAKV
jgi:hypothetical protein